MNLAKAMLKSEKAKLAAWSDAVAAAVPGLLREPVLRRSTASDTAVMQKHSEIAVNYSLALLEVRTYPSSGATIRMQRILFIPSIFNCTWYLRT